MKFRIRHFCVLSLLAMSCLAMPCMGSYVDRQSNNFSFEDSTNSWTSLTADFFGIHSIEQRGWSPLFYGREGGMDQSFLRVTGTGDIGQLVVMNGESRYQILSCMAFKQSSNGNPANAWSGFGITYYDAVGNKIDGQRKSIGTQFGSANRGYADGMVPYAIGLIVPNNAAYAYIWIWNSDSSIDTFVDSFELVNYFEDDQNLARPNLILNGAFETSFGNDEYWSIVETYDTVYPYSRYGAIESGTIGALTMGGTYNPNLIYQFVGNVEAGQQYEFSAEYRRGVFTANGTPQFGIAGVDFFDTQGNKISDTTVTLQEQTPTFFNARSASTVTAPNNVAYAVAWVWVASAGGPPASPLYLHNLSLRKPNLAPPTIAWSRWDGFGRTFVVGISDPGFQTGDAPIDFENDGDAHFVVTGDNGFLSTCTYGGDGKYGDFYFIDNPPTASGTYSIQVGEIRNGSGVSAPQQTVQTFVLP